MLPVGDGNWTTRGSLQNRFAFAWQVRLPWFYETPVVAPPELVARGSQRAVLDTMDGTQISKCSLQVRRGRAPIPKLVLGMGRRQDFCLRMSRGRDPSMSRKLFPILLDISP